MLKLRYYFIYAWILGPTDKIETRWRTMVDTPSITFIVIRIFLPGTGTATNPLPPPANWVNRFSQICDKKPQHLAMAEKEDKDTKRAWMIAIQDWRGACTVAESLPLIWSMVLYVYTILRQNFLTCSEIFQRGIWRFHKQLCQAITQL